MSGVPPEEEEEDKQQDSVRALPPIITSGLTPPNAIVDRKASVSASDTASTLLPENASAVPPATAEEAPGLKRAPTIPKPVSMEDVEEVPSPNLNENVLSGDESSDIITIHPSPPTTYTPIPSDPLPLVGPSAKSSRYRELSKRSSTPDPPEATRRPSSSKGKEALSPESIVLAHVAGRHWSSRARDSLYARLVLSLLQCDDDNDQSPAAILKTKADLDRLLEKANRGHRSSHGRAEPSAQRQTLIKILKSEYNAHIRHHSEVEHQLLDDALSVYYPNRRNQQVRFEGRRRGRVSIPGDSDTTDRDRSALSSAQRAHNLPGEDGARNGLVSRTRRYGYTVPQPHWRDAMSLQPQSPDASSELYSFRERNDSVTPGDSISQVSCDRRRHPEDFSRSSEYDDGDNNNNNDDDDENDASEGDSSVIRFGKQIELGWRLKKAKQRLEQDSEVNYEEEKRRKLAEKWKREDAERNSRNESRGRRRMSGTPRRVAAFSSDEEYWISSGSESRYTRPGSGTDSGSSDVYSLPYIPRSVPRQRHMYRSASPSDQYPPGHYSSNSQPYSGYPMNSGVYPGYSGVSGYQGYPGYPGVFQANSGFPVYTYQPPAEYSAHNGNHQFPMAQPPPPPPPSSTQLLPQSYSLPVRVSKSSSTKKGAYVYTTADSTSDDDRVRYHHHRSHSRSRVPSPDLSDSSVSNNRERIPSIVRRPPSQDRSRSQSHTRYSETGSFYGPRSQLSVSQKSLSSRTAPPRLEPRLDGDAWVRAYTSGAQASAQTSSSPSTEALSDLDDFGVQERSLTGLLAKGFPKRTKTDIVSSKQSHTEWLVGSSRADLTENSTNVCVTQVPKEKPKQALFRWIHLPCLSIDDFTKRIGGLNLKEHEVTTMQNLLHRVQKDMKTHRKSKVPLPGTYSGTGAVPASQIEGRSKKAPPEVQWICFPYFSLEAYRGKMANSDRFPIQSLMQHHFGETEKARDMKQVATRIDPDKCYHVGQVWCLLLDNKLMITSGFSAGDIENLNLVSVDKVSPPEISMSAQGRPLGSVPVSVPRKALLLVKYSDLLQWSFHFDECNTWKRFMGNFLRLYKFDLQFIEGKIAVTESLWPQIVSRLENGEKNIVLTLRIGEQKNVISSESLLPIGDPPKATRPVDFLQLPSTSDSSNIQEDTPRNATEARGMNSTSQNQSSSSADVDDDFHVIPWVHKCAGPSNLVELKSHLDRYHDTLVSKMDAENSRRYNYITTCNLSFLYRNLLKEVATGAGRMDIDPDGHVNGYPIHLPEPETHNLFQRIALFNACVIIFRFFLPLHTQGPVAGRFWRFVEFLTSKEGPMRHDNFNEFDDEKHGMVYSEIISLAKCLSDINLMLRYINLDAFKHDSEFDVAYVFIVSALSHTYRPMGKMDRFKTQIDNARDWLVKATAKIVAASRADLELDSYAIATPEAVIAALMQKLIKNDVVSESFSSCQLKLADSNIYSLYDAELKSIEIEVRRKENNHSYKSLGSDLTQRAGYAAQEILAMEEVVEKQHKIIDQLIKRHEKKSGDVVGTLGMFALDHDQNGLDDSTGEILKPSLLTNRLYDICKSSAVGRISEIESFKKRCERLKTTIEETHNTRKGRQEQAIFIFTIVTIIFLPLGTLSSIFGMNTADVRNMEQSQWLYWAVSLPITVALMAIGLWMTGDLRQLFKWVKRKMSALFPSGKKMKLAEVSDSEGLGLDEKDFLPGVKDVEAQDKMNLWRVNLSKSGIFEEKRRWK